ncbi:MAG: PD-(D/E)XK nuclease family protein [Planctomycetota bacterium]|jgi:ATP-dependent helicase/nuclease subunit B
MTKRLLLGRAGSGKTRHLLDEVARRVRDGTDHEALLLVPTYGRAENLKRRLLGLLAREDGDAPVALFDRSIVTFTSLAERVLGGTPIGALLTPGLKDALLREALAEVDAPVFRSVARFPGFRSRFLSMAKEVKEAGLEDADALAGLRDLAAAVAGAAARRRMEAFADVFEAWTRLLRAGDLVDHEDFQRDLLDAVRDAAPELPRGLEGLRWLGADGFTDFSRLQGEVVRRLAERVPEAIVTLPDDPERLELFERSRDTREAFEKQGWYEDDLPGGSRAGGGDLQRLERVLFAADPPSAEEPDGSVLLLACSDPADEVDRLARRAALWIRRDGWRPYEILVVVRDLPGFRPLLEEAFRRHGVPLRVFAPRSLLAEPVAAAARDLVHLACGAGDGETALRSLRSGFTAGVDPVDGDRLEETLAGGAVPETATSLAVMAETAGLGAVADLLRRRYSSTAEPRTALQWAECAMESVEVPGRLRTAWLEGDGVRWRQLDVVQASREAAAMTAFGRAIAEAARTLGRRGDRKIPAEEFLEEMDAALARTTFQPRDRRLHCVNAVDAEESRSWEARGVLLGGMVEKVFPRAPREDLILRDRDRRAANDGESGLRFRERLRNRDEERHLFYVACTRARERLVLSWTATDDDGTRRLPSAFLDEVRALWPEGVFERQVRESASPPAHPAPLATEALTREDLLRDALVRVAEPVLEGTSAWEKAREAGALVDALAADRPGRRIPELGRAARLAHPRPARLRVPSLRRHRLHPFRTSATGIADHHQCAYLHFARRILRLEPPVEVGDDGLDALQLGTAVHAALERWMRDGADVGPAFDEALREETGRDPVSLSDRALAARARDAMVAFAAEEKERIASRPFRPVHFEVGFGLPGSDHGALVLEADGRRIELRGRLDRVDVDEQGRAVAVDYKSGWSTRPFGKSRWERALEGIDPQVPAYLVVLCDVLGLEPAGVEIAAVATGEVSGVRVEGHGGAVAPRVNSVVLPADELDAVRNAVTDAAGRAAGDLDRGNIAPWPADANRCGSDRCSYADLCRFGKEEMR